MSVEPMFNPLLAHRLAISSVGIPDPIEFVISEKFLDRGVLYPRQATLLKTIFLRDDLFTDFDLEVIDGWETTFMRTGNEGISPGIHQRIEINKAAGRSWFKEVLSVIGRRGGKGHLGAICSAYILWHFLNRPGGPQTFYGIDRDKTIAAIVFAGKKDQAKANQWGDLNKFITSAPCFRPYLSKALAESLTIYSPADLLKIQRQKFDGTRIESDQASFAITPSASTMMAGRGPASAILMFDEMAHIIASGASRSAAEIYNAAMPSLDQFGVDGFSYQGSSPWQMQGQFYDNWQNAIALEPDGTPSFPNMMMIQMPSWNVYLDYERAHELPLRPPTKKWIEVTVPDTMIVNGEETPTTRTEIREVDEVGPTLPPIRSAVQTYDEDMRAKERANPDSFAVEYRCLAPETRVLRSDLRWVPIDSLQPGDELFALDEEGQRNENGRRVERKMRRAVVEAKDDSFSKAYRLHFDDGSSVVCSGNHRWLSSSAGSKACFRWRSIDPQHDRGPKSVMKVGDTIRYIIEPWEPLETYESGWLAGLYDGEGCVITRTRHRQEFAVTMTQNPGTVQDRVWALLEEMGFEPKDGSTSTRKARTTRVTGLNHSLRLLGQIRPLRLLENGNPGLWEGRALGHKNGARYFKTITEIEPLSEQRLVDIQTSTGTFIAEGLVSHNSHWALSLSSYLDEKKVAEAFRPFEDNGTTRTLTMQTRGPLSHYYKAHADPGAVNDNFAFAMGHVERPVGSRFPHVVIDLLKMWKPIDFSDGIVDYPMVTDDLWDIIERFSPDELTFDQFQSVMMIATLNQRMTAERRPKQTLIFEKPATRPLNWKRAELFKSALNLGLVHIPMLGVDGEVDPAGEMAELELRFLELRNGRVDHPTSGPIQHNDLSDCLFEVVWALIGEELLEMLESPVMSQVSGMGAGGVEPPLPKTPQSDPMQALANANRGAMTQRGMGSARGMRRR